MFVLTRLHGSIYLPIMQKFIMVKWKRLNGGLSITFAHQLPHNVRMSIYFSVIKPRFQFSPDRLHVFHLILNPLGGICVNVEFLKPLPWNGCVDEKPIQHLGFSILFLSMEFMLITQISI
jgi:hypothetical protein